MKLSLKFMAVVGSDGMNPKGQFFNDMIDKIDSAFLGMGLVHLISKSVNRGRDFQT